MITPILTVPWAWADVAASSAAVMMASPVIARRMAVPSELRALCLFCGYLSRRRRDPQWLPGGQNGAWAIPVDPSYTDGRSFPRKRKSSSAQPRYCLWAELGPRFRGDERGEPLKQKLLLQ